MMIGLLLLTLAAVGAVVAVILDHKQYVALQQVYNDLRCAQTTKCPAFAESEHCPVTTDNSLVCEITGVVRISLDSLELSGQLTSALGDLTALAILCDGRLVLACLAHRIHRDLSLNKLQGTIHPAIGKLTNLENL